MKERTSRITVTLWGEGDRAEGDLDHPFLIKTVSGMSGLELIRSNSKWAYERTSVIRSSLGSAPGSAACSLTLGHVMAELETSAAEQEQYLVYAGAQDYERIRMSIAETREFQTRLAEQPDPSQILS